MLFLSSKIEEDPRKLKDCIGSHIRVCRRNHEPMDDAAAKDLYNSYLLAERVILHTLCFDLAITHPYSACYHKIKAIKSYINEADRAEFHQIAINFCNDSFFTPLCLQHGPSSIAAAAIFLAANQMGIAPLPQKQTSHAALSVPPPTWYELTAGAIHGSGIGSSGHDTAVVSERAFKSICDQIMDVYSVVKEPSADQAALKQKLKNAVGGALVVTETAPIVSLNSSTSSTPFLPQPSPMGTGEESQEDYPYQGEETRDKKITVTKFLNAASSAGTSEYKVDSSASAVPVPSDTPVPAPPSDSPAAPPPPPTPTETPRAEGSDADAPPPPPPDTPSGEAQEDESESGDRKRARLA